MGTLALLCVAGCKFPELPPLDPDAAADHLVGGTVEGLWTGARLTLRLDAANETSQLITVSTEGEFTFPTRVAVGAIFALNVESGADQHTCSIETPSGQVQQLDITDLHVRCIANIAVTLQLSSVVPFTFDPQRTRQQLAVSLLQGRLGVTVNGPTGSRALLQGTTISLATESSIPLAMGLNTLTVGFTVGELSRSYRLEVDRGGIPAAEHAYGKASNREADDQMGMSVAGAGDYVAIGAPQEDSGVLANGADNSAPESGAVYIFRRGGVELTYLKGAPIAAGDRLGHAIDMDPEFVVAAGTRAGASDVNVWRRSGISWGHDGLITPPAGAANSSFGVSVGVSGETIAVGASSDSFGGATSSGAVYVFRRVNGTWTEQAVIRPPAPDSYDGFGRSLSLDGDTLAVGAFGDDSGARGITSTAATDDVSEESGAVYIFRRSGTAWLLEAYVKSSNSDTGDEFGTAVSLDQDLLAVGAPAEDGGTGSPMDESALNSGAVYAFRRTGTSWTEEGYAKTPSPASWESLGASVSARADLIAASAPEIRPFDDLPGFVTVFHRNQGVWVHAQRFAPTDGTTTDNYGQSISLLDEGLVVGMPSDSGVTAPGDNGLPASGAAYFVR